jgi:hypothetical protein
MASTSELELAPEPHAAFGASSVHAAQARYHTWDQTRSDRHPLGAQVGLAHSSAQIVLVDRSDRVSFARTGQLRQVDGSASAWSDFAAPHAHAVGAHGAPDPAALLRALQVLLADAWDAIPFPSLSFRARAFPVPYPHSLALKKAGAAAAVVVVVVVAVVAIEVAIATVAVVFAIFLAMNIEAPEVLGDLALLRLKMVVAERTYGATSAGAAQSILEA